MTSFSTYENSHLSYLFLFVFNHFIVLSFVEFQDLFYYWIMNDFMKHFQWPFIDFAICVCEYMYIYVSVYIYIFIQYCGTYYKDFYVFCIYVHICTVYFVCTRVVY